MILVMDTANNEETFLGLWANQWLEKEEWASGRNLSAEILDKLVGLYNKAGQDLNNTTGIIVNSGPGSFTGLRIGLSVANTIAYSLNIPIVGLFGVTDNKELLTKGQRRLLKQNYFTGVVFPEYGQEPNITQPKKSHVESNN